MNHIRRIPRLIRFLAAFTCAMLGLVVSAPAAFALRVRASGGFPSGAPTRPNPALTRSVVASGVSGWEIAVIVAVVAVFAASIAIAVDRARAEHRSEMVPAT